MTCSSLLDESEIYDKHGKGQEGKNSYTLREFLRISR